MSSFGNLSESARRVAGLPLVSTTPRRFIDDPHLVLMNRPESPVAERYRRLRLNLEQGSPRFPFQPQVTLITSAVPGEGKTTTAVNLALAYAEDRKHRTLLIGADLRRPSVSLLIAPRPALGLSEVLTGAAPLGRALIEMSDSKLWVLPTVVPSDAPLELLQQRNFGKLLAELRGRFDRIVIDSPPTVPFTDAAVLASYADGTVLVVRSGTATQLVGKAKDSLSGAIVLGVVLNDVAFTAVDRYFNKYDDDDPGRYFYARDRANRA